MVAVGLVAKGTRSMPDTMKTEIQNVDRINTTGHISMSISMTMSMNEYELVIRVI